MWLLAFSCYSLFLSFVIRTASREQVSEILKFLNVEYIVLLRLPEAVSREENG